MQPMDIIILIISLISLALAVVIAIKIFSRKGGDSAETDKAIAELKVSLAEEQRALRADIDRTVMSLGKLLRENQKAELESIKNQVALMDKALVEKQAQMREDVVTQLKTVETRLKGFEDSNEQKLENIRKTVSESLTRMQEDNNKKLDEIRGVVDEKLQKTLEERMNESFKLVSERLENVYKGLGEMKTVAEGVGDLKKVLSNVKTRGILGEIQLGAILSEILSPAQYDTDVAVIPKSANRVEFAVKLPGAEQGEFVYLPIDSKFPGDTYVSLQEAYETGDALKVAEAKKHLEAVIKKCAKDIHDKYVEPPYTTNFGIMFLPFEGLYAEVVNSGMVEVLQRDYSVNITGPSTMAAMLNSLQMGFKTLAIQKRSDEVWRTLGEVKGEFEKFGDSLTKVQERLRQADKELVTLVGTRTNVIRRKLRNVETIEADDDIVGELFEGIDESEE